MLTRGLPLIDRDVLGSTRSIQRPHHTWSATISVQVLAFIKSGGLEGTVLRTSRWVVQI